MDNRIKIAMIVYESFLYGVKFFALMGTIISSRMKDDGKVIFEVSVDYEESIQLRGHMEDVHIFSENALDLEIPISQRGKNDATKYFLIPKELRKGLKVSAKAKCQKIDTKTKIVFVYVVDKMGI